MVEVRAPADTLSESSIRSHHQETVNQIYFPVTFSICSTLDIFYTLCSANVTETASRISLRSAIAATKTGMRLYKCSGVGTYFSAQPGPSDRERLPPLAAGHCTEYTKWHDFGTASTILSPTTVMILNKFNLEKKIVQRVYQLAKLTRQKKRHVTCVQSVWQKITLLHYYKTLRYRYCGNCDGQDS